MLRANVLVRYMNSKKRKTKKNIFLGTTVHYAAYYTVYCIVPFKVILHFQSAFATDACIFYFNIG